MRAQLVEIRRTGHGTRLAVSTPTHGLSGNNGAAATTRFRHCSGGGVKTHAVPIFLIAEVSAGVET